MMTPSSPSGSSRSCCCPAMRASSPAGVSRLGGASPYRKRPGRRPASLSSRDGRGSTISIRRAQRRVDLLAYAADGIAEDLELAGRQAAAEVERDDPSLGVHDWRSAG